MKPGKFYGRDDGKTLRSAMVMTISRVWSLDSWPFFQVSQDLIWVDAKRLHTFVWGRIAGERAAILRNMKKGLFILAFTFLFSWVVLAQEEPFKIGGKSIAADGSAVYATDVSMLNLLGSAGEINMSMQYREKGDQWVILMTVPYKEINIPASSMLRLTLKDGKVLSLPVEREMVWSKDRISVKAKVPTYVLRIPYLATNQQIETLTGENGNVTKVSFAGKERTIEFKVRNAFTSIVKRDQKAILAMRDGSAGNAVPSGARNTGLQSSSTVATNQSMVPRVTPQTKYFEVSSLKALLMFDCVDGHFIVVESNTHQGYIFDINGNLTGRVRVSASYVDFMPYYRPVFSDGKALIRIEDEQNKGVLDDKITTVIDYSGKVLSTIARDGNNITYYPGEIVDGMLGAAYGGSESVDGFGNISRVGAEHFFLDLNGNRIKKTGQGSFVHSSTFVNPNPLVDGRRLYQDGKFGFLNSEGKTAIAPKYDNASDFSEGLAAVAIRNGAQLYWGFIDVDGKMVIEPKFSERPDDFHDGRAVVKKKNGKYVFIDKTGNVISPEFIYATRFMGGYAFSSTMDLNSFFDGASFFLMDSSFNVTRKEIKGLYYANKPILYNEKTKTIHFGGNPYSDGKAYSCSGDLILSDVGPFREEVTWSQKNHCYVNLQGEIVLQFVEKEF